MGQNPRRARGLSVRRFDPRKKCVSLFEAAEHLVSIAGLFEEGFRIPLIAWDTEKVPAIDVNRTSEAPDGVGDGMDYIVAELNRIFFAQRLCAGSFQLTVGVSR